MPEETQRLNKYLALQLGISRREADLMIEKGRVKVNNTLVSLGARFASEDIIHIDNTPIASTAQHRYVLFHKPVGYVCSRRRQGDTPTIYELLPAEMHALKPVGRLDKDSSGLLLLTNDGDFAHQMTHPKFQKTKIYEVRLDHELEPLHQQMINDFGLQLEDGTSKLTLSRLSQDSREEWQVVMSEGRNRQIRRTFAALGYIVIRLHRTQFGTYSLGSLKSGEIRVLEQN